MNNQPKILFYCQHSLGMGHLVRASLLAEGLAKKFEVHFLNGGKFPGGFNIPAKINLLNLPPLGLDDNSALVSLDEKLTVNEAKEIRKRTILESFSRVKPDAVIVELFPFGRKKFADELLPLLEAAQKAGTAIFCSLRDILVNKRRDQARHDDRASETSNKYFNGILVHSDGKFARLEETFQPGVPLMTPVHYTGFVAPSHALTNTAKQRQIVVSAGGGIVGMELFLAALETHKIYSLENGLETLIVTGALFPEEKWEKLQAAANGINRLKLIRSVPDLARTMSESAASISQCGYNTSLDIIRSRVPAIVVPYGEGLENEQGRRGERLEKLGVLKVVTSENLSGKALAEKLAKILTSTPKAVQLDLNGAANTARLIDSYLKGSKRVEMKKVMEVRV